MFDRPGREEHTNGETTRAWRVRPSSRRRRLFFVQKPATSTRRVLPRDHTPDAWTQPDLFPTSHGRRAPSTRTAVPYAWRQPDLETKMPTMARHPPAPSVTVALTNEERFVMCSMPELFNDRLYTREDWDRHVTVRATEATATTMATTLHNAPPRPPPLPPAKALVAGAPWWAWPRPRRLG